MKLLTGPSPHIHARTSVRGMMLNVLGALLPVAGVWYWLFGSGFIVHLLVACLTTLGCEALMLYLRRRPIGPFLGDGSALVTAALLSFCIPPLAPWWITVIGSAFAIVVAKHLYGGLGNNPFNPAMIGYVVLLISFPLEMSSWYFVQGMAPPDWSQALAVIFGGMDSATIDGLSMASPLDHLRTELGRNAGVSEIMGRSPLFGDFGGAGWEWGAVAAAAGGLWLLLRRIIHWQIPVALLATLFVVAGLFHLLDPERYADPVFHLFSGAVMLGAFFIATDPVSACTTDRGRLIYGACIGLLIYIIRTWGGYPDGVAFAVLLMNMAAPTIDHFTPRKAFGHRT